jgi:hypothetical protein
MFFMKAQYSETWVMCKDTVEDPVLKRFKIPPYGTVREEECRGETIAMHCLTGRPVFFCT